ncbi:hypothetical protein FCULG_00008637 [Fusarium culmorum]|uniref:Life-span regulatory factor domain-containing protein n=1 Tax=Fusarium culmorum TaxID=5516 RepID=A0A2T4H3E8_FUSCU|nr:hypothetical protein FCULG_00008637 [Fusarium culmorum]
MHHSRRKSGHGLPTTTSTDVRKTVTASDPTKYKRPVMTRRHTPQKLGRGQREREREQKESWEDERESFPQFCMTCEKQFIPHDDMFLYCSDNCRSVDQTASPQPASSVNHYASTNYPFYSAGHPEPKDIIPRASPSRPSSILLGSPPTTPGTGAPTYQHTSAISALRSLNVRPRVLRRLQAAPVTCGPLVAVLRPAPTTRTAGLLRLTFHRRYYGAGGGAYNYEVTSGGMDRPLPSRHPSTYSRPKSIELVTPLFGR